MKFIQRLFGRKDKPKKEDKKIEKSPFEEEFDKVMKVLNQHKRKAYLPVVSANENTFSDKSKIGGFPYLRNEDDWPICPVSRKHMQLFLQLNLEDLPDKKETGLIQLFYSTTGGSESETKLESFFPFSKGNHCRKITTSGVSAEIKPDISEIFDEKLIVGWEAEDDYPHYEEYYELGIDLEISDEVYELIEARNMGMCIEKDKLFGWPHWVQSLEYPADRKTETIMELLFQLASEDNLPYMFGDMGIGHLTQSPDNPEELGFGWACH